MARDLSVIIAARNEEFLGLTVESVLKNSGANTEIIVILDGYWADPPIEQHADVTIVHHETSIGQRAAINQGVKLSTAKYIMKLDAHCNVDKDFDVKLMDKCEYTDTVVPTMFNLHVFDWKCPKCGEQTYQSGKPEECLKCHSPGKDLVKEIIWKEKLNPRSEFYRFDRNLKFSYWRERKKHLESKKDIVETMSFIGACWFQHRERYWDLGGSDEGHGSWGQYGTEMACKAWFSGGRLVTNRTTWFGHMFRTGKGLGFPYKNPGIKKARAYSQNLWMNEAGWPMQMKVPKVRNMKWLINHFKPVPEWEDYPEDEGEPTGTGSLEAEPTPMMQIPPSSNPNPISSIKNPIKGIVYYTDNRCQNRIMYVAQKQIQKHFKGPIVSISQYPIDFGENIATLKNPSVLSMFEQILKGIENIKADIIFLAEHDMLYHPSHFEFTPPRNDRYYYNYNVWKVDAITGQALQYGHMKQVSGLVANRDLLLDHYKKRIARIKKEGRYNKSIGYEPGKSFPKGIDNYPHRNFRSTHPNIDIVNHGSNLTRARFNLSEYRCKRLIKDSFTLADEVPFWGKSKDNFDNFLRHVEKKLQ